MDFLEIRRKAKERAVAREAGQAPGNAADGAARPAGPAPAEPPPAAPPPLPDEGPSAPAQAEEAARRADPRFTTWRPGSGARPFVQPPEPGPEPQPAPSDFAVFDPLRSQQRPEAEPVVAPLASPVLVPVTMRHEQAPAFLPAGPARTPPRSPPRPPSTDPLDDFFFRADEEVPALAALPAEPHVLPAAGPEDAGLEEYLTFRLGAEEYAVAIECVREVLKAVPVTEVPRAPAGIVGVVTVRGEVVAVFDPRWRLGLPGPPPVVGTGRIVIVDDGEGPSGLLVDGVASVVRLARGSIEPCPQGIGGASADCLAGIGRERSRLFTVLDLGALLRRLPGAARGGGRAHAET